ncbi:MAG: hypothetical protein A2170_05480 [Deltaproteobacteria bacterium RBG_13_53_10]|nr:MAG: hypothetical protein A2170_05480 [Deltaproteobacteria bacterium RBG_13_53_10]
MTELERSHEVKQEQQGVKGRSLPFTAQERFQRFSKTTQLKGPAVGLQGFASPGVMREVKGKCTTP